MFRVLSVALALILVGPALAAARPADAAPEGLVQWHEFEPAVFEQSRSTGKPVFINLEAVWCHWCHVMDQTTYADTRVAALLNERFIAVKVDHDARPDLANRYRRWGWPATIIIRPDGAEVAKRAGYIEPVDMIEMLTELGAGAAAGAADPSSAQAVATAAAPEFDPSLLAELKRRHERTFDTELGGLRLMQKFIDADSVELALAQAADGDEASEARVRKTLAAAAHLIDPVWGGAYQYSTHGDWQHPHFEKLMRTQGRYLRLYGMAYRQLGDPAYAQVIDEVASYLVRFLRAPDGAFYVSQDADLDQGTSGAAFFALDAEGRERQGIPRIDRSVYAEANGRAIEGLAVAAGATGREDLAHIAETAARAVIATHRDADGAFRHTAGAKDGPYLADNVWMARGLLALYDLTGERPWLDAATAAMDQVERQMRAGAGYAEGAGNGTPVRPLPSIDGNIAVARVAARLHALTGDDGYRRMLEHASGYLANPDVALKRVTEAGILLVARDLPVRKPG